MFFELNTTVLHSTVVKESHDDQPLVPLWQLDPVCLQRVLSIPFVVSALVIFVHKQVPTFGTAAATGCCMRNNASGLPPVVAQEQLAALWQFDSVCQTHLWYCCGSWMLCACRAC